MASIYGLSPVAARRHEIATLNLPLFLGAQPAAAHLAHLADERALFPALAPLLQRVLAHSVAQMLNLEWPSATPGVRAAPNLRTLFERFVVEHHLDLFGAQVFKCYEEGQERVPAQVLKGLARDCFDALLEVAKDHAKRLLKAEHRLIYAYEGNVRGRSMIGGFKGPGPLTLTSWQTSEALARLTEHAALVAATSHYSPTLSLSTFPHLESLILSTTGVDPPCVYGDARQIAAAWHLARFVWSDTKLGLPILPLQGGWAFLALDVRALEHLVLERCALRGVQTFAPCKDFPLVPEAPWMGTVVVVPGLVLAPPPDEICMDVYAVGSLLGALPDVMHGQPEIVR